MWDLIYALCCQTPHCSDDVNADDDVDDGVADYISPLTRRFTLALFFLSRCRLAFGYRWDSCTRVRSSTGVAELFCADAFSRGEIAGFRVWVRAIAYSKVISWLF